MGINTGIDVGVLIQAQKNRIGDLEHENLILRLTVQKLESQLENQIILKSLSLMSRFFFVR
jgi:hypothetical protein